MKMQAQARTDSHPREPDVGYELSQSASAPTNNAVQPPRAIACSVSIKEIPVYECIYEGSLVPNLEPPKIKGHDFERICNTRPVSCDYRKEREGDEPLCTKSNEFFDRLEARLLPFYNSRT